MAMKTEDSLVFSWEGRHIPFLFSLSFRTISLGRLFSFLRFDFLWVSLSSWLFIYIFVIHIPSLPPFCSHFDAFRQFSLYSQKCFHGTTFSLHVIPSQMPWSQRFLAMMNHSEPFLFILILWFAPMFCAFPLSICYSVCFYRSLISYFSLALMATQFAWVLVRQYIYFSFMLW